MRRDNVDIGMQPIQMLPSFYSHGMTTTYLLPCPTTILYTPPQTQPFSGPVGKRENDEV